MSVAYICRLHDGETVLNAYSPVVPFWPELPEPPAKTPMVIDADTFLGALRHALRWGGNAIATSMGVQVRYFDVDSDEVAYHWYSPGVSQFYEFDIKFDGENCAALHFAPIPEDDFPF